MKPDLVQLRRDARSAYRASLSVPMVRKVYLIPADTVAGVLRFQAQNTLASEVEAARVLLDRALEVKGFPKRGAPTP